MGQAPSGIRLKSISAIGSTQLLAVAHDGAAVEPRARVLGRRLDDGGQREVVLDLALRDGPAGDGDPGLLEQGVRYGLAAARREGPEGGAGDGNSREFERAHDVLFPLALPVDALAQVERE